MSILIPYFLRNQSESIKTKFGQGLAILADDVKKLATTNNNNTKRLEAIEAELKATKAEVAALKAKKQGQKSKKSAI